MKTLYYLEEKLNGTEWREHYSNIDWENDNEERAREFLKDRGDVFCDRIFRIRKETITVEYIK